MQGVGTQQVRQATLEGDDRLILEAELPVDDAPLGSLAGGRNVLVWPRIA